MDKRREFEYRDYKKGLTLQREIFKNARQVLDFKTMLNAISNLKADLKHKAMKQNRKREIEYVEKIIKFIQSAEYRYSKLNQEGERVIKYPLDWNFKKEKLLNVSYEILLGIQEDLELL